MTLNVVSYGGGVNSTALLIGLTERGIKPDLVLFSDTGGEMPDTYKFIESFEGWMNSVGLILTRVTNAGRPKFPHTSLENECHNNKTLPSLAFGFKGCSVKWKRQPMDRYIRDKWPPAKEAWGRGEQVTRLIGIDWGEQHRGKIPDDKRWHYEFPLIDWEWGREECIAAIHRAGFPTPSKSACFYCPATKKNEIIALHKEHPDLFQRAIEMEDIAKPNLKTVRGLARKYSWRDIINQNENQLKLWPDIDEPCMCFDGED